MAISLRLGEPADLEAIVALQSGSPALSQWRPQSLAAILRGESGYRLLVALWDGRLAGFLLWREIPAGETEILSLTVAEPYRRRGLAEALLRRLLSTAHGPCFLEVRVSNAAARALYSKLGFIELAVRPAYYHRPVEDALVMRRAEIL